MVGHQPGRRLPVSLARGVEERFEHVREAHDGREGEESLERLRADADPAAHAERGELEAALQRAITELPEERRVVVVLRDFEGLSYEEIAAALDLPLGTVRSRLHRARTDLKEKLERFLP